MTSDTRELLTMYLPANTDKEIVERLARAADGADKSYAVRFDRWDLERVLRAGNVRAGIGKAPDPVLAAKNALRHIKSIGKAEVLVAMTVSGTDTGMDEMAEAQEVVLGACGNWGGVSIAEEDVAECTVVLLAGGA